MKNDGKIQKMIDLMNQNLHKVDLNKEDNSKRLSNPLIPNMQNDAPTRKREESIFSNNTVSSINSGYDNKTLQSMPFKEEKDLDLPNFTATKYNPLSWRLLVGAAYFFYSILLLLSTTFLNRENNNYNIIMLIAHICFCVSSFFQWSYYKRGCIGESNYNSKIKRNIDNSSRAKLLRSEEGWKYFFTLIGSLILIFGNIYKNIYPDEDIDYCNMNMIGSMIVSLSQILKLEKILTENKAYMIKNDLSNCLLEIFLFFGSLFFGVSYFIQIMYNYDLESLNQYIIILKFIGNGFILLSGFFLLYRYFLSDYDDLNISSLSNATL